MVFDKEINLHENPKDTQKRTASPVVDWERNSPVVDYETSSLPSDNSITVGLAIINHI